MRVLKERTGNQNLSHCIGDETRVLLCSTWIGGCVLLHEPSKVHLCKRIKWCTVVLHVYILIQQSSLVLRRYVCRLEVGLDSRTFERGTALYLSRLCRLDYVGESSLVYLIKNFGILPPTEAQRQTASRHHGRWVRVRFLPSYVRALPRNLSRPVVREPSVPLVCSAQIDSPAVANFESLEGVGRLQSPTPNLPTPHIYTRRHRTRLLLHRGQPPFSKQVRPRPQDGGDRTL